MNIKKINSNTINIIEEKFNQKENRAVLAGLINNKITKTINKKMIKRFRVVVDRVKGGLQSAPLSPFDEWIIIFILIGIFKKEIVF